MVKRPLNAKAMPALRAAVPMTFTCSAEQFERLKRGRRMTDMSDPWNIFYEEPWIYFVHASGIWAFGLRFERDAGKYRTTQIWATREPDGLEKFGYKFAGEDLEGNAIYLRIWLYTTLCDGAPPTEWLERLGRRRKAAGYR